MISKKKIVSAAVTALLIAAIVLCITVITQTMSKGYVTIFGNSMFRVVTGSMEPTIPVGSILVCKDADIEEIQENDIICFRSKMSGMLGQVITHRVIAIGYSEDGQIFLETCGDANPVADGYYVTETNLIGKVSFYTKEGNLFARILDTITSRIGFLACIVFPVFLIAGLVLRDSIKNIRKELNMVLQENKEVPYKEQLMTNEEYEEMVLRLKKEIMEEVRQSVEQTGQKTDTIE